MGIGGKSGIEIGAGMNGEHREREPEHPWIKGSTHRYSNITCTATNRHAHVPTRNLRPAINNATERHTNAQVSINFYTSQTRRSLEEYNCRQIFRGPQFFSLKVKLHKRLLFLRPFFRERKRSFFLSGNGRGKVLHLWHLFDVCFGSEETDTTTRVKFSPNKTTFSDPSLRSGGQWGRKSEHIIRKAPRLFATAFSSTSLLYRTLHPAK